MKTYSKSQMQRVTLKTYSGISKKQNCNIIVNAYSKENALKYIQNIDDEITFINQIKTTNPAQSVDEFEMISENTYSLKMREA